jgi:hypothetical protein
MGLNCPERNQRFTSAALRNHGAGPGLLPTPDQAHDGKRLRWVGLSKERADYRRGWVVNGVQRRERPKNSLSHF